MTTTGQTTMRINTEQEIMTIEQDMRKTIARLRLLRQNNTNRDFRRTKLEMIDRGPRILPTSPLRRFIWSQDDVESPTDSTSNASNAFYDTETPSTTDISTSSSRKSSLDLQAIMSMSLSREDVTPRSARAQHLEILNKRLRRLHLSDAAYPNSILSTDELNIPLMYAFSPSSISSLGVRDRSAASPTPLSSRYIVPGTMSELLEGSETDYEDEGAPRKKQRPIGSELWERRQRLGVRPKVETIEESDNEEGGAPL